MFQNETEKRRTDIVSFCLRKPRRYKEIAEKYEAGEGSITNDLKVLREKGLLEKTIYDGKQAYQASSSNKRVQKQTVMDRRELEKGFEKAGGIMDSDDSKYDKEIDISMRLMKEVLEDNSDNPLVDEEWVEDFDPEDMGPGDIENIGKILERLSPPRSEDNIDIELKENKISGGYKGPLFFIDTIDDEESFIQRVDLLQSFDKENKHDTRFKTVHSPEKCDQCNEEVDVGEKLFLIDQPMNLRVFCMDCNKKKEVIDGL